MTINEYVSSLEETEKKFPGLKQQMLEQAQIWSNSCCKGYCLRAMQNANLDADTIQEVLRQLSYAFSDLTNEDAENIYNDYF